MCRLSLVALAATLTAATLGGQAPASRRTGARPTLDRPFEIALARSAAPASVSSTATVLVLTDSVYAIAVAGTSKVTCLVNRSWRDSVEPHCFDAEGSESILPIEMRRTRLRIAGRGEAEIARDIRDGLARGIFHWPRRPAMSYMMSAGQVLYDDTGHLAGKWHPHLMIYYPKLTGADVGFAGAPDMSVGMVSDEGTPEANLTIIMGSFVPVD